MAEIQFTREELECEEWRDVVGYEGVYSVSNLGRVRRNHAIRGSIKGSVEAGHVMSPCPIKRGYLRLSLHRDAKRKSHQVATLVTKAFIGPQPTPLHQVNHKDGVKINNREGNLEWATNQENQDHANNVLNVIRPTRRRGEGHHNAYFTESDIRGIRQAYAAGQSMGAIARGRSSTVQTISRIVKRKGWRHVE